MPVQNISLEQRGDDGQTVVNGLNAHRANTQTKGQTSIEKGDLNKSLQDNQLSGREPMHA